jgi:hypothetical protein
MQKNMLRITDSVVTDKKTKSEIINMVSGIRKNGIPKTIDGLLQMYNLYNRVFGQTKKPTNCIYCRKNVFESLEKAIMILDIKPDRVMKSEQSKKTLKKKRTPKKTITKK